MNAFTYQVIDRKPLTANIIQLILAPVSDAIFYRAGQYIEIVNQHNQRRPFSIANAPNAENFIELHIRHTPIMRDITYFLSHCPINQELTMYGPFGQTQLNEQVLQPYLFLAGGTGIAPIKALIEELLKKKSKTPLHLFWGVSTIEDLYLEPTIKKWQQQNPQIKYTFVLSKATAHKSWLGEIGYVHEAAAHAYPDMGGLQVYAAGPSEMVLSAHQLFKSQGLNPLLMFSDALNYLADSVVLSELSSS